MKLSSVYADRFSCCYNKLKAFQKEKKIMKFSTSILASFSEEIVLGWMIFGFFWN